MKVEKPVVGALCKSLMGRDKDVYFIVYKVNLDNTIYIVDGNYRRLEKPKLKKLKHVRLYHIVFESIAEKINASKQLFDSEIYSALKPYNNGEIEIK